MSTKPSLLKNSVFLSGKVVLSIAIAFFSSRLLLINLGVSDFGLYNIVAGFILLLSSLRTFFSTSIQRFLNVAKGKSDLKQMNAVLNLGIYLHAILAFVFLLVAETIGLWYVNHKMVLEPSRIEAANYVYQFSVAMGFLYVLFVPFEALIVAHERLKFYAINTTLELVVKFLIIITIAYIDYDNLVLYAFLLMVSTLLFRINILRFSIKNFKSYTYSFKWNANLFHKLVTFSGWSFLGSITYVICHEGINIVLNLFGGTVINAARGLAYQIMSALNQFSSNLTLAVSPRVMTNYASEKEKSINLLVFATKSVFYLMLAAVTPLLIFLKFFLELWLTKVPEYTAIFTTLIIGYLLVKVFVNSLNTLILSHGDLKLSSSIQSFLSLLVVPIAYLILYNGLPYHYVFIALLVEEILRILILTLILKSVLKIEIKHLIKNLFLGPIIVIVFVAFIMVLNNALSVESKSLFLTFFISGLLFAVVIIISFIFGINKDEKTIIKQKFLKVMPQNKG